MMSSDKIPAALYAIHSIMVKARWLAGQDADREILYKLLDSAETLPSLIACADDDMTEEFREQLAGLGQECPDCAGFVGNFDRGVCWSTLGQGAA